MPAETFYLAAPDGKKLHVYKWSVENPKAVLQVTHGAVEHAGRYAEFASFLNEQGYSVYANDLRGHGKTAEDPGIPYFSDGEGGWDLLVEDMHALTGRIREENADIPVFLLGHSMGSFLAVSYYAKYGADLKGGIVSGTGTNSPVALKLLKSLANRDVKKHGNRHPSPFLHNLAFGSLNAKIKGAESPYDFICTDRNVIDAYIRDECCGNTATSEFLREMARGIERLNDSRTYEAAPKDLGILFISGEFDPLGGNKLKAMRRVYEGYKKAGVKDVSLIVYEGARHESLNEPGRQKTYRDVAEFIKKRI
jgi:alpha-beta hydrolase superfamily lysophospholipase